MFQGSEIVIARTFAILEFVFDWLFLLSPIWLPILLIWLFINMWLRYIRMDFINSQEYVLLEIKLPEEITKPVSAMEHVFAAMYQSSTPVLYKGFWKGEVVPWFSLELVSIGGDIHFFIWTPKKFAGLIEHQIYGQYSDAEVVEVPDYTNFFKGDPEKQNVWGTHFVLSEDDWMPIKSYVDYGLDKASKPEETVDPITAVLEYMGSFKKGEQVWIQILIRPHTKKNWKSGETLFKKDEWKKKVDAEIEKLVPKSEKDEEGKWKFPQPLKPGMDDFIKSLYRHQDKLPFDTAIRGVYVAEEGAFNELGIVGLIGSFRQWSHPAANGFKIKAYTDVGETPKNLMEWVPPVKKWVEKQRIVMKTAMFEAYRLRSFFHPPYKHFGNVKPFVLSTEELATIFHFPGRVAQTPTFRRIESKKSEPPTDLPI